MKAAHAKYIVANNIKATMAATRDTRDHVNTRLDDPSMRGCVPPVAVCSDPPRRPTCGLQPISPHQDVVDGQHPVLPSPSGTLDTPTATSSSIPSFPNPPNPPHDPHLLLHMKKLATKRAADEDAAREPAKRQKKKPRTCIKCESQDCPGRKKQDLCGSSCALCGREACYGQNSRKRGKGCGMQVWSQDVLDGYHQLRLTNQAKS